MKETSHVKKWARRSGFLRTVFYIYNINLEWFLIT